MTERETLIEYLKTKTGGALVMTPKELALEIRVSEKQQSKLRQENRFPIPHRLSGSKVLYSIFSIADFLTLGQSNDGRQEEAKAVAKTKAASTKPAPRNQPQDLSQRILLGFFASTLHEQRANINQLIEHIETRMKAESLVDDLEKALPSKPAVKRKKDF